MMLTKSSLKAGKRSAFWQMFSFTLLKNKAIIIMGSVIALLVMPVTPLTNAIQKLSYYGDVIIRANDIRSGMAFLWMICTVMLAILIASNLRHMHRKNALDVFGGLPITRRELYFSRFLASIVATVIPALISYSATAVVYLIAGQVERFFLAGFGLNFLFLLVSIIILGIFAGFFMLLTGHTYDAVQSFFIFNFGLPLLITLLSGYITESLYGADMELIGYDIILNLSPLLSMVYLGIGVCDFDVNGSLVYYYDFTGMFIWLGIAMLVLIFSLWFAKKRKSEKAGEPYAHPLLPIVLKIMVSIIAAFIFSLIFAEFGSLPYMIAAVICGMIASVIFSAIMKRGFKKLKKDIILGAVSGVSVAVFCLVLITGGLGFENRVPAVASVESVSFSIDGKATALSDTLFTEPEDIMSLADLHSKIVKEKPGLEYDLIEGKTSRNPEYYYGDNIEIVIEYKLEGGRELRRTYSVETELIKNELLTVMASDNFMNQYEIKAEYLSATKPVSFQTTTYSGETQYLYALTEEQIEAITESYLKEYKQGKSGEVQYVFRVSGMQLNKTIVMSDGLAPYGTTYESGMVLKIPYGFTKTISLIKDSIGYVVPEGEYL